MNEHYDRINDCIETEIYLTNYLFYINKKIILIILTVLF